MVNQAVRTRNYAAPLGLGLRFWSRSYKLGAPPGLGNRAFRDIRAHP